MSLTVLEVKINLHLPRTNHSCGSKVLYSGLNMHSGQIENKVSPCRDNSQFCVNAKKF